MTHRRYLITLRSIILSGSGTLDEAHTEILASWRRNGFRSEHETVDTWTEPGRIVEQIGEYGRVVGGVWEAE
jgi:hypothetical protein